MKQIAQNYKSGELTVLDVPAPTCRPGGVLVRSLFSLISAGTEMMKVNEASMSMVGMARARPDQVRKVLGQVQQQGVVTTYKKVMNKLDSYTPLGYSLCGVVTEVGKGAEEFKVGQLVACAGNDQALHAEYNFVPVNLCAAVPDGVSPEHAAFATVASIAIHGVRRAEVQLGETAVVIGLGLIGQLVVRLLVAAGVQAVGVDPVDARCRLAEKAGAAIAGSPDDLDTLASGLAAITSGRGADHIFLAAGGNTNGPVETAVKLARDRARVVDIGKMKLDLPWNAYYEKELDVRFSRSYGPGRYDSRYELEGIDYPVGYVRWTEKRNLESFLGLLARNSLEVASLIDGVFPFKDAAKVYGDLKDGTLKAVGVLLEYEQPAAGAPRPATSKVAPEREGTVRSRRRWKDRARGTHRLRRRGKLRLVHAAAAPGAAGHGQPGARRDDQVAVGGERAAEVRLHHGKHRRRRGIQRREPGRDLHRDQARDAREAGVPGAGDRQGGIRREAARADPRRDRRDRRGHRARPATTG